MSSRELASVTVDVTLFTQCGDRIKDAFALELEKDYTVLDFLELVSVRFPDILLVEEKTICHALIFINNKLVSLDAYLKNGDKIRIHPLIDGG